MIPLDRKFSVIHDRIILNFIYFRFDNACEIIFKCERSTIVNIMIVFERSIYIYLGFL